MDVSYHVFNESTDVSQMSLGLIDSTGQCGLCRQRMLE